MHRDFYHEQVLCDRNRLAILDLDDAAMSEPRVDIANFRAHLMLLGAQQRGDVTALAVASDAFLDRHRQLETDLDERLLAFLTATTLLRLSGIHVSRKDGPAVARMLIEAADHALATCESSQHVVREDRACTERSERGRKADLAIQGAKPALSEVERVPHRAV